MLRRQIRFDPEHNSKLEKVAAAPFLASGAHGAAGVNGGRQPGGRGKRLTSLRGHAFGIRRQTAQIADSGGQVVMLQQAVPLPSISSKR